MSSSFYKLDEGIHLTGSFYVDMDEEGHNLCIYYCTMKDYADYALSVSTKFRPETTKVGDIVRCYEPEGKLFRLAGRTEVAKYMKVLTKYLQGKCNEI